MDKQTEARSSDRNMQSDFRTLSPKLHHATFLIHIAWAQLKMIDVVGDIITVVTVLFLS